jgi:hypothetical protein
VVSLPDYSRGQVKVGQVAGTSSDFDVRVLVLAKHSDATVGGSWLGVEHEEEPTETKDAVLAQGQIQRGELLNLGVGKVYIDRASWYFSKVQLLMVAYLYFDRAGWSWYWLLAIPLLPLVVWAERKWIISQEYGYYRDKGGYARRDDPSKP